MKKMLILSLIFCLLAAVVFASESDGIFSYRVGQFEVYMLVGAEREGNATIIPGANDAVLKRFIPASGFMHATNAFLIKAPGRNILVDTAFGGPIFEKLEKLGVKPEQIDAVLLSHLHGDHIGGLQANGRPIFPNAKIYLDSKERDHFTGIAVNQGAVDALRAYGSSVITFDALPIGPVYKEILPGISAIANYGHTPGHTVFLVESRGEKLIIAGDFLHVALVQFSLPEISATFDMDQRAAASSRTQIMDYAARRRIPVGAMHIVYPGIGIVEADGFGFKFVPLK